LVLRQKSGSLSKTQLSIKQLCHRSFLNTGAARWVNVCCSIQDAANKYYKRQGKIENTNERTMTAHGVEKIKAMPESMTSKNFK
jgi:hypothetical protein